MARQTRQRNKGRGERGRSPHTKSRRRRISSCVWHVVDWDRLYEPDPRLKLASSKYAILYIRWWVNGSADGKVAKAEIEGQRRAIRKEGGLELIGILAELLCMAGDRPRDRYRGYLVNHLDVPASVAEIAERIGLDEKRTAWALRALRRPEVAVMEQVAWPPPKTCDRTTEADADAAHAQGATRQPSRPDAAETPTEVNRAGRAALDPSTQPDASGGASAGEGSRTCAGQDKDKGKEKGASLTAGGKTASAERKRNGNVVDTGNIGDEGHVGAPSDEGPGAGRGDAPDPNGPPAETEPGGSGGGETSPANPSRADDRGGEPAATGGDDHNQASIPPAETEPGGSGHGENRAPTPARPDEQLWREFKADPDDPVCWAAVRSGQYAHRYYGRLIYRIMGLPMAARAKNRDVTPVANKWRDALVVGLPETMLLKLCENGIRIAQGIADQRLDADAGRGGEVRKPGALWIALFKKALGKAVTEYAMAKKAARVLRPGVPHAGI